MKISDAMSSPAVAVPTRTPLGEVARQMDEYGVGSVVVTEGGTLRGIVTDRDLAVRALARGLDPDERVDTVMSSNVVTVDASDDIHKAYRAFRRSGIRRLPVLDGHRVVGVLTVDDLFLDVFERLADLLGPVAWSILEEPPGPPSTQRPLGEA
ncbi:CBS domain-containing protein [Streptomyces lunaelactis]|uniref:CBS domain-containing protein n=1 Tax=Streptomyces lunaelactis TaxID=1535768 RepID=A0A2R4TC66_9ACTN|nr:CBS domain-containing protein [Streptomyces lunaelactis]AVZ76718.1 CBS domain-containing protein [Streptomyces lunaelactis]NUK83576.1 CBS domain-containing protein [Streptomyces lunaelactis]